MIPSQALSEPWTLPPGDVLHGLGSRASGLSSAEAVQRRGLVGRNELGRGSRLSRLGVLGGQLRSPLLLLLLFAALVSGLTGQWVDAGIVFTIVLVSVGIGYQREYSAQIAAAALRARLTTRAAVIRDGRLQSVPVEELVPGDVVRLSAGCLVPADGVVLAATDCYVSEATLTGESFPVDKQPGPLPAGTPLGQRRNCVFMGSNVRSGTADCVIVTTGDATELGRIGQHLRQRPPEAEFDRGVRRFGTFLTMAMLVIVLLVFATHALQGRPAVETLLFSIALAVGLSPELLPVILSVNLARSAQAMAAHGVLVRRLNAIENLGSMDVLCTDKTGTLTEGMISLEGAYDPEGNHSPAVLALGALNAGLETGLANPLDDAILAAAGKDASAAPAARKLAEIPFDFVRKRVSVVVAGRSAPAEDQTVELITKGAFEPVLAICTQLPGGIPLDDRRRAALQQRFVEFGRRGIRVLAVATRRLVPAASYGRADEQALTFAGFLTFLDRPKQSVAQALADLARLGVAVKVITGDSRLVAEHLASLVGMPRPRVLSGVDLDRLHTEALWRAAEQTDLFVEVDPHQKERIILALKKAGHVVGFLGDGVNDAPAMHAADTSLSVDEAVDVAREAADFVLLERDLDVIRRGIEEGRRTFANTLKYILTTTSANLGNMLSMAVASLFLPFLPLTAGQILLNNLLSDVPAVGLASDRVDPELVARPERWDMRLLGRFMLEFGLLSSAFDFLTFAVLLYGFGADVLLFRTGWFVESLLTELVVALVVRTRRSFLRSRPGRLLLGASVALVAVAFLLPFLPHAGLLGFVPLPAPLVAALVAITMLYVLATEVLKRWFYRPRVARRTARFKPLRSRGFAALVVLIALAISAVSAEAHADDVAPQLQLVAPPLIADERPLHPVRAAVEEAALLLGGSIWYWRDLDFNSRDWDLRWDWPSWKRKLTLDTVRFDQNLFQTNAVSHPRAGFAHYQVARGNGLGLPGSVAVVAATSVFWEYVVEYRELASMNDMIVNTVSGVAIGEPFYQLGEFFLRSRPSLAWRGLAGAFSPIASANDWVDGRRRPRTAVDVLGLDREVSHRFHLAAGVDTSRFDRAASRTATTLEAGSDLAMLAAYGRAGAFAAWTAPGTFTSIAGRLSLDGNGPTGGSLLTRTSLGGRYTQDLARDPGGQLVGRSSLLGAGSAFEYEDFPRPGGNDYLAVMNVVGPIGRFTAARAGFTFRWDGEVYGDFAMVKALGFEGRLSPMQGQLYRPGEHGGTMPGVIGARGYIYGYGATAGSRFGVGYRGWDVGAELRGSRWANLKGFDRFQEELIREPDVIDRRVLGRAWVGLHPFGRWWRLGTGVAWRWRSGSADDVTISHLDTQVALSLSLVF